MSFVTERGVSIWRSSDERGSADALAMAAGQRWAIERYFEAAKQETSLDEYEVRFWHGWRWHVILSMLALVSLAAVRAETDEPRQKRMLT